MPTVQPCLNGALGDYLYTYIKFLFKPYWYTVELLKHKYLALA